ncbi:MAG: HIT family protein [Acidimicrobiia bacterium]|nr:HIT family protein [Acidimicrobiia bacterium]
MSTIFTKIIDGEIPSHRVYEDERTFAFLDINPRSPGHTLVVPKVEVDELFDLPAADFEALWSTVRLVGEAIKRTLGCDRVFVMVIGIDVPHAHVHLIPSTASLADLPMPAVMAQTPEELAATASRIATVLAPPE